MFPASPISRHGLLPVGDGHQIYWEEAGNPEGIPALYLHGGPGGGIGKGGYRTKLDPSRFRMVAFDQRGCGQSRPHATDAAHDLATNTTAHLIADIEALRGRLGIDGWVLNGASWGSTLALAYAQAHPARVLGIVLIAVTTTRRFEVDWITESVGAVFPEAWDRLARHAEQAGIDYRRGAGRLVEAYLRLMLDEDQAVRDGAARAWTDWEDTHISIGTDGVHHNARWDDPEFRQNFTTLVTHYWSHDGFCVPPILGRMQRLAGIPGVLIHGRRDVSGPAVTAWELHQRWPDSKLVIDESDGHGGNSMVETWASANNELAELLETSTHRRRSSAH